MDAGQGTFAEQREILWCIFLLALSCGTFIFLKNITFLGGLSHDITRQMEITLFTCQIML